MSPADRVERFVNTLLEMPRGLDREVVHQFHTGDEREAPLLVADLRAIVKDMRRRGSDETLLFDAWKSLRGARLLLKRELSRTWRGEVVGDRLKRFDKAIDRLARRLDA